MDKTIEVIVVAMVAIATAVGLIFMVQGQSGSFADFADGETSSAKCSLWSETGQCDKFDDADCSGTCQSDDSSQDKESSSGTGIDCDELTSEQQEQVAECSGGGGIAVG